MHIVHLKSKCISQFLKFHRTIESVHLYIVRCSVETFGVVLGTHVSVLISGGYGGQAGGAGRLFR